MSQLDLFGPRACSPRDPETSRRGRQLAEAHAAGARLAAALPVGVRFGTSSWSFPGWAGLVYAGDRSERSLAREGLREYARHPLLRTVGIDRSFYAPIPESDWRRYADQLPEGYPCCPKAPASVTSPYLPGSSRDRAGDRNATFLSASRFIDEMLEPVSRAFAANAGPFIFEISPTPRGAALDAVALAEALDAMFSALPAAFRYAVELRDPRLLTETYARVLAARRVSHVYNYWSAMPMPGEQGHRVSPRQVPFCVVRLLLRPGTWYAEQRERFRPFDRVVAPDPRMRADVTALVAEVSHAGGEAFVLVNNKAEGCAPLTVTALAEQFAASRQPNSAASQ